MATMLPPRKPNPFAEFDGAVFRTSDILLVRPLAEVYGEHVWTHAFTVVFAGNTRQTFMYTTLQEAVNMRALFLHRFCGFDFPQ